MNLGVAEQLLISVVAVALGLWFSFFVGRYADGWFWGRHELRYIEGDGDALLRSLPARHIAQYVPHATALGLYREADAAMRRQLGPLLERAPQNPFEQLVLVNFAETLSELGQSDKALQLTEFVSENALVETGRRCVRAWIFSAQRKPELSLKELDGANDSALGNYKAEFWFTLAFAQLSAGRLDEAEYALKTSEAVLVRASSQRNFHFLLAQLRWKQGRRDEALVNFDTAAKHRWRWQGGSGLLAWGDALKELGRDDEARAAWTQCISQDPQSLAAKAARNRLNAS